MKNTITNSAKIVVSLGVVLGMVTMAGAASVVGGGSGATTTAGGTTTSTTTYTDPCAGSSGSGSTWTAPGSTAPAGNVAAPVNVSGTAQWKPGKLTLGSVPCPMPLTGWTPGSALTVNGITDTTGFSNWGSTFLKGVTAIGTNPTMFTSASGTPQPMLYVQGPDADAAPAGYRFARAAALFDGQVVVKGPYGSDPTTTKHWLYVGGYPVCNQNGAGCPTATATTTTGAGPWTVSGANIYNSNTGNVGIGVTSPVDKLQVATPGVEGYVISGGVSGGAQVGLYSEAGMGYVGTKTNHDFGIYTNNGASQFTVKTTGSVRAGKDFVVNDSGTGGAGLANGLRFGGAGSGEGITSNRTSNNLEFYTGGHSGPAMSIAWNGITSMDALQLKMAVPVYITHCDTSGSAGSLMGGVLTVNRGTCGTTSPHPVGYLIADPRDALYSNGRPNAIGATGGTDPTPWLW